MGKVNLMKAGGILAFVMGISQMYMALVGLGGTSTVGKLLAWSGSTFSVDAGPMWVALILAYPITILGALLASGAGGMISGIVLIVCALLSIIGGPVFIASAILVLTGGIFALISGFGNGGTTSGVREMMATARRMAEAAKEADTSNASDNRMTKTEG